ncbi:hypothetical protein ACNI5L_34165, partial [Klebsiella pneumoniae]|uniref:hypothetical protein n=2 Tax=Klebsiella pneumoniae TaxID=573 RepID=UPI003A892B68
GSVRRRYRPPSDLQFVVADHDVFWGITTYGQESRGTIAMSRLGVDELWGLASLAITQFHPYKGIMTINMALV